jgi:hypothetical protein
MLNRILKMNRMINIDLEKRILPISTGEYGDSFDIQNKHEGDITSSNILNKQSNAYGIRNQEEYNLFLFVLELLMILVDIMLLFEILKEQMVMFIWIFMVIEYPHQVNNIY